ncbi:actin-related protein 5 [Pancytospora epiphaga]|nr:actin-related protein 5 [Pancytospora epiphaga]
MVELSERQIVNTISSAGEYCDTLVIDNGVYGLRAGYKGHMSIAVRNMIYKNKDRVSFDPFPLASSKTMFDGDVLIHFDVLEQTMDMILEHIKPDKLENLIITSTPYSPTEAELIDFLFSVYRFNKIQIGTDFIYAYHKYFDGADCLIVSLKYSSIVVSYVSNGRADELYKISFGGKDLLEYINFVMADHYKDYRKDFRGLGRYMRASLNYNEEAVQIYKEMCAGNYDKNIFISDVAEVKVEHVSKKPKKSLQQAPALAIPVIDYELLDADDSQLDATQQKDKKRYRMLYYSALHRLKSNIEKSLETIGEAIKGLGDRMERQYNEASYTAKKKVQFETLKRSLELRERLRCEAKNRKTREFQIKKKVGPLGDDEQKIRDAVADAEDEEKDAIIIAQLDKLSGEILELDPNFIPYYANTVEILRGDNIGRQCINVDLIKGPEIFFHPSIIGSEEMGLAEVLEYISSGKCIRNVLVCGGFSYITDVGKRISTFLNSLSTSGDVNLVVSGDTQGEAFDGACFSPLYPVYTREEFKKHNSGL